MVRYVHFVRGKELPNGTILYYYKYGLIEKTVIYQTEDYASYLNFLFIEDQHDELWATNWVRNFWEKNPLLHPHATLFSLLYKLEIEEVTFR